jgi:hypothetical protein
VLPKQREIEQDAHALFGHKLRDDLPTAYFKRDVSPLSTQDDDGETRRLAISGGANAPPVPLGIDDDNLLASLEQLLSETPRGVAFPARRFARIPIA